MKKDQNISNKEYTNKTNLPSNKSGANKPKRSMNSA